MGDDDMARLRALAEAARDTAAALPKDGPASLDVARAYMDARDDFRDAADPAAVLALLNERAGLIADNARLVEMSADLAAAEARAYARGLRDAAGVCEREMREQWEAAGPAFSMNHNHAFAAAGMSVCRDAILALIPTTTIEGENA